MAALLWVYGVGVPVCWAGIILSIRRSGEQRYDEDAVSICVVSFVWPLAIAVLIVWAALRGPIVLTEFLLTWKRGD